MVQRDLQAVDPTLMQFVSMPVPDDQSNRESLNLQQDCQCSFEWSVMSVGMLMMILNLLCSKPVQGAAESANN